MGRGIFVCLVASLAFSASAFGQGIPRPPGMTPSAPQPPIPDDPARPRPPANPPANPTGAPADGGALGGGGDDDFGRGGTERPQVSTGTNDHGLVFEIWTERHTDRARGSKLVGQLVVTGATAATGMQPNTEHFFWFERAAAWNRAGGLYLKLTVSDARGVTRPAGTVQADTFNNRIRCIMGTTATPAAGQWKVLAAGANPASLVKGASSLFGYWRSSQKCLAIAPGPDGWIDLLPVSEAFTAKSWGTPL